jgi:hypothetical protein
MVEALKQGRPGGRKKKKQKGSEGAQSEKLYVEDNEGISKQVIEEEVDSVEEVVSRPEATGVLPSGFELLIREENNQNSQNSGAAEPIAIGESLLKNEAVKLLGIQKSVGFTFEVEDKEVCDRMIVDELRDRAHKEERETVIVNQ